MDQAPIREPPANCSLCGRLAAYRQQNSVAQPRWFNRPVPCVGDSMARLLVVGLAPGLQGANRTGTPFTGDHSGRLLRATLMKYGFAAGDDGLMLRDCRIANAVRCVPPANLPTPAEIAACNRFLVDELAALPHVRIILSLGLVAHSAVLKACRVPLAAIRFSHGTMAALPNGLILADSYHVSRYNISTRRLTSEMFDDVVRAIRGKLA
jgi:uracil-DNA glycosylase family 4